MERQRRRSLIAATAHRVMVLVGSMLCTAGVFLLLPLIQAITSPNEDVWDLDEAQVTTMEEPDTPEVEEQEQEEPPDPPEAPEMESEAAPDLTLDQINDLLSAGDGAAGYGGTEFTLDIGQMMDRSLGSVEQGGAIDQVAYVLEWEEPELTRQIKRLGGGGTVVIKCLVDAKGRVRRPMIVTSPHPSYDKPALNAIKRWRFEPARSKGRPVESRVTQAIEFPRTK